jgi:hypothetical protein
VDSDYSPVRFSNDDAGCVVGVAQKGTRLLLQKQLRDGGSQSGSAADGQFDFSNPARFRRQFTAARGCCCSARDGKLSLDDPVRRWVSRSAGLLGQPITIRPMLHHMSGAARLGLHRAASRDGLREHTRAFDHRYVLPNLGKMRLRDSQTAARARSNDVQPTHNYNLLAIVVESRLRRIVPLPLQKLPHLRSTRHDIHELARHAS